MNIVIINGSHRRGGNCSNFAECAKNILSATHSVNIFNLIDMNIGYCLGCLNCEEGLPCPIEDEFTTVLEPHLENADVIILATPTYFNMPSAAMVNFLDRTNKMCEYFADNNKKCLLYLVGQTDEESIGEACRCLRVYTEIMGMKEISEPVIQIARMPEDLPKFIIDKIKNLEL